MHGIGDRVEPRVHGHRRRYCHDHGEHTKVAMACRNVTSMTYTWHFSRYLTSFNSHPTTYTSQYFTLLGWDPSAVIGTALTATCVTNTYASALHVARGNLVGNWAGDPPGKCTMCRSIWSSCFSPVATLQRLFDLLGIRTFVSSDLASSEPQKICHR